MSFNPREYDYNRQRYEDQDAADKRAFRWYLIGTGLCFAWMLYVVFYT